MKKLVLWIVQNKLHRIIINKCNCRLRARNLRFLLFLHCFGLIQFFESKKAFRLFAQAKCPCLVRCWSVLIRFGFLFAPCKWAGLSRWLYAQHFLAHCQDVFEFFLKKNDGSIHRNFHGLCTMLFIPQCQCQVCFYEKDIYDKRDFLRYNQARRQCRRKW